MFLRRMLKAPPVNPRTYIYRYYNIDQQRAVNMFENMFKKALKLVKRLTILHLSGSMLFGINWTNPGPTSVNLFFVRPQCCKPRILKDLTDIVILSLTFTL